MNNRILAIGLSAVLAIAPITALQADGQEEEEAVVAEGVTEVIYLLTMTRRNCT